MSATVRAGGASFQVPFFTALPLAAVPLTLLHLTSELIAR
jgi:hypothetical protein